MECTTKVILEDENTGCFIWACILVHSVYKMYFTNYVINCSKTRPMQNSFVINKLTFIC